MKDAIVLAGGLGTRLKSVVSDLPKPMALVDEKPFLTYILDWLSYYNISRVILSVGYKWKIIREQFGYRYKSMDLTYSVEDYPLGTGGAISKALQLSNEENVFIINGDTFFDINLKSFIEYHKNCRFDISIALKQMKNFDRYGTVCMDTSNHIYDFLEKKPKIDGLINGGIYILNKDITELFPKKEKFSFEKDFLECVAINLKLGGFLQDSYFIDIGVPEDYLKAQIELPAMNHYE
jgi:D-glycero-alpha-D-manno-heptose 1-phosphate guanylyltransferase